MYFGRLVIIAFIAGCLSFQQKSIGTGNKTEPKIVLHFTHYINDTPAVFNKLIYNNLSGNKYMLKELQYFVSDIKLQRKDGTIIQLNLTKNIHYVDNDLPATLSWALPSLKVNDTCYSISFRFGLSKQNNRSFLFRNRPENLMAWPDMMGGGYHYMKMNLKYIDKDKQLSNFNCHLGPYKTNNSDTSSVIDNSFEVTLYPSTPIIILSDKTTDIQLQMNINKWFDDKFRMDMNQYPDGIMDNETAMQQFCNNGAKAFTIK